jgi:hypothetical protein
LSIIPVPPRAIVQIGGGWGHKSRRRRDLFAGQRSARNFKVKLIFDGQLLIMKSSTCRLDVVISGDL